MSRKKTQNTSKKIQHGKKKKQERTKRTLALAALVRRRRINKRKKLPESKEEELQNPSRAFWNSWNRISEVATYLCTYNWPSKKASTQNYHCAEARFCTGGNHFSSTVSRQVFKAASRHISLLHRFMKRLLSRKLCIFLIFFLKYFLVMFEESHNFI